MGKCAPVWNLPRMACPVCQADSAREPVAVMPCRHVMCGECFVQWSDHWRASVRRDLDTGHAPTRPGVACPLCREPVLAFGLSEVVTVRAKLRVHQAMTIWDVMGIAVLGNLALAALGMVLRACGLVSVYNAGRARSQ